jgi:hypothetical protein
MRSDELERSATPPPEAFLGRAVASRAPPLALTSLQRDGLGALF